MKKYTFCIMAVIFFTLPLISQEKDEDDDNSSRSYSYWDRSKVGGAGGVTPIVGMFDNKEMDKMLTSSGLPTLGADPIYLIGGEGYGYIMFLKNVRMGGFGASGSKSVVKIETIPGGELRKEVEYGISYGGFLVDYVQPIAYRLDIAFGASIGGGEIELTMRRDDGKFKEWNTLWNDFGTVSSQATSYTRKLNGTFVVFNPHVNIEYTLITWLQLRIGAGYPIMISPEWTLDEKYDINNVPSKIRASGYTINAGIMFGFFGW
ncbi:MAG: hypothetical protein Q8L88_12815 [Bacteroidota bacterium]|nr:hypothetical protein [Bacteroidota bacterium]